MIELRYSSSIGPRATSSPMKRDGDSSPLIPENYPDDDEDRDRHSSKDRDRPFSWYNFHSWCPFFGDDSRVSPYNSRISLCLLFVLVLAGLISAFSIVNHWNAPYLCKKDGIVLHCPLVKEGPSLWENPYSTTTSWKPCAERRDGGLSDLPPENETNGYIFIHAEGGLNQQRIAV